MSVLFVDLVGYTALAESRDAEEVRDLLGRYFETARTIIGRYGGVIEKFIGDAVMAVWGVPVAREDDAERAVRAGLDLVDAVTRFGEEVGAPALRARAGVVTGQVASRTAAGEGLVVGDRVNTASRVQSTAEPGTVFVDEVTRQATSAAIAYEDAGEHAVKGKAEPLRLWRAARVVAGVAGAQREEGLEAPFVGRDGDLRLVKDLFHQGIDRRSARLVAVSGPAGSGKSRLRWEFQKYTDGLADDVLWHSGRCPSYGDGVAFWALAEMVRQRLGVPEEAEAGETDARLATGIERWIADPAERAYLEPRLRSILGIGEPGLTREELFAGWRLFFERLADHAPVVMVLEDMQWADDGLLDFIEHLLDWSAQHPIFVLALMRPELGERREGWPAGRRGAIVLYLDRLDDAEMGELLDALVDGLPAEARTRIVAQAEGIPLYAVETVRSLADRGVLAERDGRLVVAGQVGELDVPASLSSLLSARLDALDPEAREIVKAMSIFGGSFPRSAVAALGDVPEERIDAALRSLVRRDIFLIRADPLSPDRGQYQFAQALLRTVAYDMHSRRERRPRHLAAAEHLRTTFPNDGEDVAEVIAAHLLDAYRAATGDPDADDLRRSALAALRRAAQRAAALGAPDSAQRSYHTAVELAGDELERAELLGAAGTAAAEAGRPSVAVALLEQAAGIYTGAGRVREAAMLTRQLARSLYDVGRSETAVELCRAALQELEGENRADVSMALGQTLARLGRPDEAMLELERALALAEALGRLDLVGIGLVSRANVLSDLGRFEQARMTYEWVADARERYGLWAAKAATLNVGHLSILRDLPGGIERAEAALAFGRRIGDRVVESLAGANLAWKLVYAGRWDAADRLVAELRATSTGDGAQEGLIFAPAVALAVLRGEDDSADALRADMRQTVGASDVGEDQTMLEYTDAIVRGARGELPEAVALFLRACERPPGVTGEGLRNAWPFALDAALAANDLAAADRFVELIAQAPPGHVSPFLAGQLHRGRGLLAAARGDDDVAGAELGAAVTALELLDYPPYVVQAQRDLAGWLLDRGRGADATVVLDAAAATAEALGARALVARIAALRVGSPAALSA